MSTDKYEHNRARIWTRFILFTVRKGGNTNKSSIRSTKSECGLP